MLFLLKNHLNYLKGNIFFTTMMENLSFEKENIAKDIRNLCKLK